MSRRVQADSAGLREAAQILASGGLVVLPTETFYGVAASIDRPEALARLERIKERPAGSPFPLLVLGVGEAGGLRAVAPGVDDETLDLVDRFWPGPLTLVLPGASGLAAQVLGPGATVGVRWSPDLAVTGVLELLGRPITATSANLRGEPAPRSLAEVSPELAVQVDLLVDGGARPGGLPSTVLRPGSGGEHQVLREGCLPEILIRDPDGVSLDTLRRGRVVFLQPRREGLRVNIDPVLLAVFLRGRIESGPVVDLGTGVGILPLLLASDAVPGPFVAVEIQESLVLLARENARLAGHSVERLQVLHADLRSLSTCLPRGSVPWVVSNPPYVRVGEGKLSPYPMKAGACHELTCTLEELSEATARLLAPGGRFGLVHRGDREAEVLATLDRFGLVPIRLQRVLPSPGARARRILVEAERGSTHTLVRQPDLVLHPEGQRYCHEVAAWLEGSGV